MRTTFVTAGYREGLADARARAVQPGFDEGYLLGSAVGVRVGWLKGLMGGLVDGLDFSQAPPGLESKVRVTLVQMNEELRMDQLLGQEWIGEDGLWKWTIEDPDATIQSVASAHPVVRRWNRVVTQYCRVLGVERNDPAEGWDPGKRPT